MDPRDDRIVFYAAAVSSFLETSVPLYTRELRTMFAQDAPLIEWLDRTWEPEESGHSMAVLRWKVLCSTIKRHFS